MVFVAQIAISLSEVDVCIRFGLDFSCRHTVGVQKIPETPKKEDNSDSMATYHGLLFCFFLLLLFGLPLIKKELVMTLSVSLTIA